MKLEECKVGMKVSHAEFGKGKIVHIDNNGRVSVQFKLKNGLILHSCGGLAKENSGGWFNDAGLDELTIRQPKAKVPEFDFRQCLLDNGFKSHFDGDPQDTDDMYYDYNEFICINYDADLNKFYFFGIEINPTSSNVKILIKLVNLAKELS